MGFWHFVFIGIQCYAFMTSLAMGTYLQIVANNVLSMRFGYREYKEDLGEWPFDDTPITLDKGGIAMEKLHTMLQVSAILVLTFMVCGLANMYCFLVFIFRPEVPLPGHKYFRIQFRRDVFKGSQSQRDAMHTGMFPAWGRDSDLTEFDTAFTGYDRASDLDFTDYDARDTDFDYTDFDAGRDSDIGSDMGSEVDLPDMRDTADTAEYV